MPSEQTVTWWREVKADHDEASVDRLMSVSLSRGLVALITLLDDQDHPAAGLKQVDLVLPCKWPILHMGPHARIPSHMIEESRLTVELFHGRVHTIRASGVVSWGETQIRLESEPVPRHDMTFLS